MFQIAERLIVRIDHHRQNETVRRNNDRNIGRGGNNTAQSLWLDQGNSAAVPETATARCHYTS